MSAEMVIQIRFLPIFDCCILPPMTVVTAHLVECDDLELTTCVWANIAIFGDFDRTLWQTLSVASTAVLHSVGADGATR